MAMKVGLEVHVQLGNKGHRQGEIKEEQTLVVSKGTWQSRGNMQCAERPRNHDRDSPRGNSF